MSESLQGLLGRCGAGDDDAIAELVCRFRPRALGLAAALLDDRDLAEDAVQEAFLTALSELPRLRDPQAFPAWFRQIVRTRCNRIIRRRKEVSIADTEDAVRCRVPGVPRRTRGVVLQSARGHSGLASGGA